MLLFKNKKLAKGIVLFGGVSIAMVAIAGVFSFSSPEMLSENSSASKTKLVRVGDGWLISTYGDAYVDEYDEGHLVYDTKADAQRLARDIFVTVCHPANNEHQCSQADDWSAPINVSNTARVTSIDTKWNETLDDDGIPVLGDAEAFYGDSGKPNIFNAGNYAVVTWVDKYCEGGAQRIISYNERGGVSVPFSCVYAAYTNNVSGVILDEDGNKIEIPVVWNTLQLTSGERDAKSDANKGVSITYEVPVPDTEDEVVTKTKANWVISWQEDPHGLQLGGADGPGDGASGAAVTHGTDVWYTYTTNLMYTKWADPVRITNNYTNDGAGGNTSPVFHPEDPGTEIVVLERGNTGASRPNLRAPDLGEFTLIPV